MSAFWTKLKEQREENQRKKLLRVCFQNWMVYRQDRLRRKERRKVRKFQVKVIKGIFKKHF